MIVICKGNWSAADWPCLRRPVLTFKVKKEDGSFYKGKIKFIAEDEALLSSDDENPADDISLKLRRKK
jgi:hypothetical protein